VTSRVVAVLFCRQPQPVTVRPCTETSTFAVRSRSLATPARASLYKGFDLLWLDGEDLRPLPWSERTERMAGLLERLSKAAATVMSYVEPICGEGSKVLADVLQAMNRSPHDVRHRSFLRTAP